MKIKVLAIKASLVVMTLVTTLGMSSVATAAEWFCGTNICSFRNGTRLEVDGRLVVRASDTDYRGGLHVRGNRLSGEVFSFIGGDRTWVLGQGGRQEKFPPGGIGFYDRFRRKTALAINQYGNVGIGTLEPQADLHITNQTSERDDADIVLENENDRFYKLQWRIAADREGHLTIRKSHRGGGSVQVKSHMHAFGGVTVVGDVSPGFDVSGDYSLGSYGRRWKEVWAEEGVKLLSDERWKRDITTLSGGLASVLKLSPVRFRWKEDTAERDHFGLIAQQVEPILPEVVERQEDPEVPLSLNYAELVPVVIKAIQEQQELLEEREARIAALEAAQELQREQIAALLEGNAVLAARLASIERRLETGTVTALWSPY